MKKNANDLYNLGHFRDASELKTHKKEIPFIIASCVFTGKHEKARELYNQYNNALSLSDLIFCRFHLGISYTRTSNYMQARNLFLENFKYRYNKAIENSDLVLIFQGLSFYRFFFSLHNSSLYFARKAETYYRKMSKENYLFGALINDILSHNYYQLGEPAKGKLYSENALMIVKDGKLDAFLYEFKATQEIYNSEFNPYIDENIKKLKKVFKDTPETNDYTLSEIVLQIAKQFLLKGNYKKANDILIQNFNLVYKNDNKRKVAKLNTLLAQILIFKHQYIEALSLLKVAKSNLDVNIDLSLISPIIGLEKKCFLKLSESTTEQDIQLSKIAQKTDKAVLQQEYGRYDIKRTTPNIQDRLSSVFNSAALKNIKIIDEIIKYNVLHLIRMFFPDGVKKQVVFIDPRGKGMFTISEDEVNYINVTPSKNQLKTLEYLMSAGFSKEELVKSVWGYEEYDPFRHDHLVYTLIKTLRKNLGKSGEWLRSNGEDFYYLDENTDIIFDTSANLTKTNKKNSIENPNAISKYSSDLNFRQVQILEGSFIKPFSAGEASLYFGVNRMTAFRDLSDLVEKGLLEKRGRLKGTKYYLNI